MQRNMQPYEKSYFFLNAKITFDQRDMRIEELFS